MIDLNQVSMRLKNSAYALEQVAKCIPMHYVDKERLIIQALHNKELAAEIDAELENE